MTQIWNPTVAAIALTQISLLVEFAKSEYSTKVSMQIQVVRDSVTAKNDESGSYTKGIIPILVQKVRTSSRILILHTPLVSGKCSPFACND
mmetsp:Transcript_7253/g.21021  ORF Transcript_7253/g.21021 Transcript_7253/m.21021 type:complete len:91 (+) Transcript_7253:1116-1388(+)